MDLQHLLHGRRNFPDPFKELERAHRLWSRYHEARLQPSVELLDRMLRGAEACILRVGGSGSIVETERYLGLHWERIGRGISLESLRLCMNFQMTQQRTGEGSWLVLVHKIAPERRWSFDQAAREGITLDLVRLNELVHALENQYQLYRNHQKELLAAMAACTAFCSSNEVRIRYECGARILSAASCSEVLPDIGNSQADVQRLPTIELVAEGARIPFGSVLEISVE